MSIKPINDDYKLFGDRLRQLREKIGLSQAAFSELFNMPQQTYQNYEAGTRKASLSFLRSLAEYYSVSIDYLVGNEPCIAPTASSKFSESTAEYQVSSLSHEEYEILEIWREASYEGQEAAKIVLKAHKKTDLKNYVI